MTKTQGQSHSLPNQSFTRDSVLPPVLGFGWILGLTWMDGDTESYVLLLLSDGNLPTGSFVASSGLEAYVKHGFFALSSPSTAPPVKTAATINFLRDSVQSYARSTLSFISAIYEVCVRLQQHDGAASSPLGVDVTLRSVTTLDDLYESTTLNHGA